MKNPFEGKDGTIVAFKGTTVTITSKNINESRKIFEQIYKDFKTNNLLKEE